ncbi:MAG: hypothetical protein Q9218_007713 [Villophora microphyllina]
MRIPFFRIFYSTTFTVLSLVLAILLLITPANLVYEAIRQKEIYNIFIVAGAHVLTLVVVVLLYASRLYNNRRNLLHIPSDWSPTENGAVERKVRKLIAEKLEWSAVIAHRCTPRDLGKEEDNARSSTLPQFNEPNLLLSDHQAREEVTPSWGTISHPGWSSPSSTDLPNINFESIIQELPNLIEAKAVSLAPVDPLYIPPSPLPNPLPLSSDPLPNNPESEPPPPDPLLVTLLQRPTTMGLRDYIAHLTTLGMLDRPDLTHHFLALYEKARFSGEPIGDAEFRHLMAMFADILRSMKELDTLVIEQVRAENGSLYAASSSPSSDRLEDGGGGHRDGNGDTSDARQSFDSNATGGTVQHTPFPLPTHESFYTSQPHHPPSSSISISPSSASEAGSEGTVRTAPSHPGSKRDVSGSKASRSSNRTLQERAMTGSHESFREVMRQVSKTSLASQGSVIRLAEARTELDLPFVIFTGDQEFP